MILKLTDQIISKTVFNNGFVVENEYRKTALLRIITGSIIFVRFLEILASQVSLFGFSNSAIVLCLFLVIISFFTIGFITPVANLLIIILIPVFDTKFTVATLGSTIAINLLIVQLFINAGQYYSVDRMIMLKNNMLSKLMLKLYSVVGVPDITGIKRAYFIGFLLYAISSLYALLLHVQDPYWIHGVTIRSMLTNSYMCKHAFVFRGLESMLPGLLDIVSIGGVIGQSIFQILMIPLVFFKFGGRFVKIWGFIFFFISLFLLSLSYLPHLELILWLVLFCPFKTATDSIKILYDDKCNLCKKAMRLFKWANVNDIYDFSAISKNRDLFEKYSLTEEEVKVYMAGIYKGKVIKGYELYILLFKRNPVLVIFYPLLWIGKITGIGPAIYNAVARNRYKLLGMCEVSFSDEFQKKPLVMNYTVNTRLLKFVTVFYILCIALFLITNNILFKKALNVSASASVSSYHLFCKRIGIDIPKVFNDTDLSMGDSFMVIEKMTANGWKLVPITGYKGERLNYLNFDILLFTNHNSDLLYFGKSLKYRRFLLRNLNNIVSFHEKEFGKEYMEFMIRYDYKYTKESGDKKYRIIVYTSNASKVKLFEKSDNRYELRKVYEKDIVYNDII